jgi:hypothetical protein
MYADMFNREWDGGSGSTGSSKYFQEKIHIGGAPVEYILPSVVQQQGGEGDQESKNITGGNGPFQNKVVPAGLVFIPPQKTPDFEYDNEYHQVLGENRKVIPEALFDALFGSVSANKKPRRSTPPKRHHRDEKRRSRKQKQKQKRI